MDGWTLFKCDNKCKTTSPLCFSPRAADDQAPVQASGLRARRREGHPRARLLQTHRLGTPGEQGDTAAVQAQSGKWLLPCTLTAGRSSGFGFVLCLITATSPCVASLSTEMNFYAFVSGRKCGLCFHVSEQRK